MGCTLPGMVREAHLWAQAMSGFLTPEAAGVGPPCGPCRGPGGAGPLPRAPGLTWTRAC